MKIELSDIENAAVKVDKRKRKNSTMLDLPLQHDILENLCQFCYPSKNNIYLFMLVANCRTAQSIECSQQSVENRKKALSTNCSVHSIECRVGPKQTV